VGRQPLLHNRPKATEFGEITHNKSYYAVQGYLRSSILEQVKSQYATSLFGFGWG